MASICLYFHVHQPLRVKRYRIFDIGHDHDYFSDEQYANLDNRRILNKVAQKCYLPANAVLLDLLRRHPEFRVSFSITGILLEQLERWQPEVLASFQALVATGRVELISETYYHSLAFLYSREEFRRQVIMHREKLQSLFGVTPTVFRNTELIYNNDLAGEVAELGYQGILTEGADHILGWRSPNFLYTPPQNGEDLTPDGAGLQPGPKRFRQSNLSGPDYKSAPAGRSLRPPIKLLLKNYRLSDDIAFRFSSKEWPEYPLTAPKFSQWVNAINGNGEVVNLFMDYETFGEHQWEDTGIFNFLRAMPEEILRHPDNDFVTPSEAISRYRPVSVLDIPHFISWADIERDLSAWLSNPIQHDAIGAIYALEADVKRGKDPGLLRDWERLQTSDHFYYMCTKWFSDGDVHKYFSPYESPYEAFIAYMNVIQDMRLRLQEKKVKSKKKKIDVNESRSRFVTGSA